MFQVGVLKNSRRKLRVGFVIFAAATLLTFYIRTALAAAVEPTFHAGNPKCEDFNSSWTGLSVSGAGSFSDGTLSVTVVTAPDPSVNEGLTISWSSNIGVDAVFVKGGPNGNLYQYDPPSEPTSDSGLHTPANPNGGNQPKWYGLSHILFCYDTGSEGGTTGGTTGSTTGGSSTGGSTTGGSTTGGSTTGGSTTGGSTTGGSTTGGSTTGGSTTGETTGGETTGSDTGGTDTTGTDTTGGDTGGETTGGDTGTTTGTDTTGETTGGETTGQTTGNETTGGTTGGGTTTGGTTGTTGTTVQGSTGQEVLGSTQHQQPLATTGSETTILALIGFAMLLMGATLRFGKFAPRAAYAVDMPVADELVTKTLALVERTLRSRSMSRNWNCNE